MPIDHPQDWLIIMEALIYRAEFSNDYTTVRDIRAWELAVIIAKDFGLELSEYPSQIDWDWDGRSITS